MDADALDKKIQELVAEGRMGSAQSRLSLRKELDALFDLPRNALHEQQRNDALDYAVKQLVDGYPEKLNASYDDCNLIFEARTIPATRKDGSSFYLAGDLHFFYVVDNKNYVLGRMDGMGHGVEAALIVLSARKCIEELVSQRVLHPDDFTRCIGERLAWIPKRSGFTTLFMSVLDGKRLQFTDVGDGQTILYEPGKGTITKIIGRGTPLGALTPEQMQKFRITYKSEERPVVTGDTIVSFTDGIYDREGYDSSQVESIISSGSPILNTVETILNYALKLPHKSRSDDVTIIGLTIK